MRKVSESECSQQNLDYYLYFTYIKFLKVNIIYLILRKNIEIVSLLFIVVPFFLKNKQVNPT